MAQITTGVRSILSAASVYNLFMRSLGAVKVRKKLVRDYIKPTSGQRILDIGCGTAEILEYLPEDIEYIGFDASTEYIAAARKKYPKRNATFYEDFVKRDTLESHEKFDTIISFGVLHHLDDTQATDLFFTARQHLRNPDSKLITLDNCWLENQRFLSRYLISKDRGQNVRFPEEYSKLARLVFDDVDITVTHDLLRVAYDHVILTSRTTTI